MEKNIAYLIPVIANVVRYTLIAGIPFLIFYILFPNKFSRQKIQQKLSKPKDWIREFTHSLQTMGVFSIIALIIIFSPLKDYTQIYRDIHAYTLWWIPASILLAIVIQDTYFYWMHRTIHHRRLFRTFHLVHHRSTNPTPLASHAFNISESILEALIIPIILMIVPMHLYSVLGFVIFGLMFNVYGHLGYEIMPRWFRHSYLFHIMNTSVHHNLHHEKFKGNYGYYFRIWDRLMGTENPDYVKKYDEIQAQRFPTPSERSYEMLKIFPVLLLLAVIFLATKPSSSTSIVGLWKDSDAGGVISIYEKEGKYYGRLISADDPKENAQIQGLDIIVLKNFKDKGDGAFCCGILFQPKYQRTLDADLTLVNDSTLEIEAHYGIFSGMRIWKRL
ncbi:MAG: sterol desaturase family protein [Bacteroidota bacterium]